MDKNYAAELSKDSKQNKVRSTDCGRPELLVFPVYNKQSSYNGASQGGLTNLARKNSFGMNGNQGKVSPESMADLTFTHELKPSPGYCSSAVGWM